MTNCQDSDRGCPYCAGRCTREATCKLIRVDMEDQSGTDFCDECSEDALGAGVFRVQELDRLEAQLNFVGWESVNA